MGWDRWGRDFGPYDPMEWRTSKLKEWIVRLTGNSVIANVNKTLNGAIKRPGGLRTSAKGWLALCVDQTVRPCRDRQRRLS